MKAFFNLVRVEWIKTVRMRSTYIAFAVVGLHVAFVQIGSYFAVDDMPFFQLLEQRGMDTTLLLNGFITTRIAMEVGFVLLVGPMVIMTFARQIAGEDLRGTLRSMLVRPISRAGLIAAKFVVCAGYCLTLMGFFLGLSYGMGLILYGPHDSLTVGRFQEVEEQMEARRSETARNLSGAEWEKLTDEQRIARRRERRQVRQDVGLAIAELTITPGESALRLVFAWGLGSWALLTLGALAFFFSSINKHPVAAMALTVGAYFMVMILQQLASAQNIIPMFKQLQPYLFTTAMDFWRGCFSYEIDWGKVGREAALLGAYTAVFYTAASLVFWRKDITS